MVGGDRRGPPDPGPRRRHSHLGVLSHIRLRHHPLELGEGIPTPPSCWASCCARSWTAGLSETGYCNEEYDQLYADQGIETNPEGCCEIIWEMQEILMRDLPDIIPYYDQTVQAYRNDTFTGWQDSATRLALEDPTSLTVIRPGGMIGAGRWVTGSG